MLGTDTFCQGVNEDTKDTNRALPETLLCSVLKKKKKKVRGGINTVTGSELIIFINNETMLAFQVS